MTITHQGHMPRYAQELPDRIDHEWLQTRSGRQFFPRDPDPDVIDPKEIAVCLSRIPRFGGHTTEFYSVAQHSIFVANLLAKEPIEIRLAGLLHDAEEVYTGFGDLVRPIRDLAGKYPIVKQLVDAAVERRFKLPAGILGDARIKHADMVALATEKRDLLTTSPAEWIPLPEPASQTLHPWSMSQAAKAFSGMLNNLTNRWWREWEANAERSV